MKIFLQQSISASPEKIWDYICDAEKMNQWSLATVRILSFQEPGNPASIGTRRQICVKVLGMSRCFEEEIAAAEFPKTLQYRVISGIPVHYHQGTICLKPEKDGVTTLTWEVSYKFKIPLAGIISKFILLSQLRKSLQNLARLLSK